MEHTQNASNRDAGGASEHSSDDDPYHIDVCMTCQAVKIEEQRIEDAARATFRRLKATRGELSVAVVDDAKIAELNRRFRNEDHATDVLSFDWAQDADDIVDGEVVVSAETAQRTADRRGTDAATELVLYVVHGCLHLMGFDDLNPEDAARMHNMENDIMTGLGYGAAYGEVSP